MADECVVSDIVTKFLLDTCRLRPQPKHIVHATWRSAHLATMHLHQDTEGEFIPLTTGSLAEFYIEPMLPHLGDVDVMFHRNTQLAIPRGHPPPTQLPAEFSNYVRVREIVDSHLPGYVYLALRYLLKHCTDHDKYNYMHIAYDNRWCLKNLTDIVTDQTSFHGPAVFTDLSKLSLTSLLSSTMYSAYVVCRGRHKPLIGQQVT